MPKEKSMTRNLNHDDDASSKYRFNTWDNRVAVPWSDLNHVVLFLIMMKFGVIDFISFSGVCKSWRSLALDNKSRFMASRPPMSMSISNRAYEKECYCILEDFEERKFKTLLPHSVGRICVGLTCGYLVLFGRETRDFWLVNPITRQELHFPDVPDYLHRDVPIIKAILVFSRSISEFVFVVVHKFTNIIWFSISGKGAWNHVHSTYPVHDLHAFKGKVYTLTNGCRLFEMRLNPEPELTLLDIENFWKPSFLYPEFVVNSGENLYVMDHNVFNPYKFEELDFGKMMWVTLEKTLTFFISNLNCYSAAINPESWADHPSQYKTYSFCHVDSIDKDRKYKLFTDIMWYFPHRCLDVDLID
ncbi:unnamed protein product [Lactuca virosa]|uniref:F-box domain-containing protein n=1 Tax=Lactuca virosa TaxID=75947 RepID=A0AAU9MTQ0_9ASTR|nr:unnamed protein product [Lactuca virosa]